MPHSFPRTIGVQFPPHSFYTEGIDHVLDLVQETVGANLISVLPGFNPNFFQADKLPLVDHGVEAPRYESKIRPPQDRRYFEHLNIQPPRQEGDDVDFRDIFSDLHEPVKQRGMQLFARLVPPHGFSRDVPGSHSFCEIDAHGIRQKRGCLNHPDFNAYVLAIIEEMVGSHPWLDGWTYFQEWHGPLDQILGKRGEGAVNSASCFCEFCREKASRRGIDPERAATGYRALQALADETHAATERPVEGWFIQFWRLFMEYPEVFAWEKFWWESLHEHRARIYGMIKSQHPKMNVGWHVHHAISLSISGRAGLDYRRMLPYSDHIKPVIYHACMGHRLRNHQMRGYAQSLFKDLPWPTYLEAFYAIMGFDPKEAPAPEAFDQPKVGSLGPQYVGLETRRAVEAAAGRVPVWAGIGFDVIDGEDDPETIYRCTKAAFVNGADGLLVSREYHEMQMPHLEAVGSAVRELES